ncbi:MAG TPA: DUF4124 domain-containing protein [Steroidobacteraceae bacterium]|nr:DUF4124 domain-containing protein [Steroidobacteraceae bacterium]
MLSAWLVASAGTTVYTWVDAQGVTHYSDQPHAGATKLKVQDAPTFAAPPVASVSESQAQKPSEHNQCSIESPTDQQMFMNAYSVSGRVHLPQVNPGDRLIVMLDGTVLPGAADLGGHFTIPQVDRGTHTLAAQLLGPTGQVICEAPSVTFYVHQPNLNSPTNQQPVAPPPRPRG